MGIIKDGLYLLANKKYINYFKQKAIFPYYHIVSDNKVPHINNLYNFKNIDQFKNDLDFLIKNYNSLDPNTLCDNKKPKNSFLLSFDDGLQEIYSVIYPILKEKNIKAVFFINPDFVDNKKSLYKHDLSIIIDHLKNNQSSQETIIEFKMLFSSEISSNIEIIKELRKVNFSNRKKVEKAAKILKVDIPKYLLEEQPYISSEEIKKMIADGFYFGAHTMSHPPLKELDFIDQKKEIIDSIDFMKSKFNINYSFFAFPFSDKFISKKLLDELFSYDSNILLFGNSGIKKDVDERIIQRFSLEKPNKLTEKLIVTEYLYSYYNRIIGKYRIERK